MNGIKHTSASLLDLASITKESRIGLVVVLSVVEVVETAFVLSSLEAESVVLSAIEVNETILVVLSVVEVAETAFALSSLVAESVVLSVLEA